MDSLTIFYINSTSEAPFNESNTKIACFDYDWTLVKPKSGNEFPKDQNDYCWLYTSIPRTLQDLYNDGYSIYIFTNQTKPWKLNMISESLTVLDIPIKVIVGNKEYKKPNSLLFNKGTNVKFNKKHSFYVGDAAGRTGDFSNSDREFAENVGITFKTPEEVFEMDLVKVPDTRDYHLSTQECVILVGYPASGKSTFAKTKFEPHNYHIVDGDTLKTLPKMLKEAKSQLQQGKSVVIDATNGKKENRNQIIKMARDLGVPSRCFVFTMDITEAMQWNTKRTLETGKKVPKIAFWTYRKHYVPPTVDECPIVYIK